MLRIHKFQPAPMLGMNLQLNAEIGCHVGWAAPICLADGPLSAMANILPAWPPTKP